MIDFSTFPIVRMCHRDNACVLAPQIMCLLTLSHQTRCLREMGNRDGSISRGAAEGWGAAGLAAALRSTGTRSRTAGERRRAGRCSPPGLSGGRKHPCLRCCPGAGSAPTGARHRTDARRGSCAPSPPPKHPGIGGSHGPGTARDLSRAPPDASPGRGVCCCSGGGLGAAALSRGAGGGPGAPPACWGSSFTPCNELLPSGPSRASRTFSIAGRTACAATGSGGQGPAPSPPALSPVRCWAAWQCRGLPRPFRHKVSPAVSFNCDSPLTHVPGFWAVRCGMGSPELCLTSLVDALGCAIGLPWDGAGVVALCASWAQGCGSASSVAVGGAALAGPAPFPAVPCPWLRVALPKTPGSSKQPPGA